MVKTTDRTAVRNDAIRTAVSAAAQSEATKQPFHLSGRGHEARVTLDRHLAAILRGMDLPRVHISGYGPNHHYPRRIFEVAMKTLKRRLGACPIKMYEQSSVYLNGESA